VDWFQLYRLPIVLLEIYFWVQLATQLQPAEGTVRVLYFLQFSVVSVELHTELLHPQFEVVRALEERQRE
jgi:hypothetical protein